MKKPTLLFLSACAAFGAILNAQPYRYLDEVFSQVSLTTAQYGSNYTVLTLYTTGHTSRESLEMDVYTPVGDVETSRPLVIYCHSGNFLPWMNPATMQSTNGSCGGVRTDSATVEMCSRLAKMGYVVASIDYRLGWRPDLQVELQRRFTLINAAYRGVQDVRTCIRYFRKTAAEEGNPFGIDPDRIVVFGQGTGGFLSLNAAALDQYAEIMNTSEPDKFKINGIPMVNEFYNGDPYGIQAATGVVDSFYYSLTAYPLGDTLYVQNHPGYSSEFNLAVNLGGALCDKAWLDTNTPPILSFHVPADPYVPCGNDWAWILYTDFGVPVINVSGSCAITPIQDQLGNNDVFSFGGLLNDPLSVHARTINGNSEAFYPLKRPPANSAPWEWNGVLPLLVNGQPISCNTNAAPSRTTIDTIMDYFAPRACRALGLDCPGVSVSTDERFKNGEIVKVLPNPAKTEIHFQVQEGYNILSVELSDISGRALRSFRNVNSSRFTVQRDGMAAGIYIARIQFSEGIMAKKVVLE